MPTRVDLPYADGPGEYLWRALSRRGQGGIPIEFRLLGRVEVDNDGMAVALGGRRQRTMVAALLLRPNLEVRHSELAQLVWETPLPDTYMASLRNYRYRMRRAMERAGEARLVTGRHGSLLHVESGELDVTEFRRLAMLGHGDIQAGRADNAVANFRAALALWHGPALADVAPTKGMRDFATRLTEEHGLTVLRLLQIRLDLGEHDEMLGELRELADADPPQEQAAEMLMLALHRSGRRDEALAVYSNTRSRLIDQLGLEPNTRLAEMHLRIINGDESLDPPRITRIVLNAVETPAQLPMDLRRFVGREAELRELDLVAKDDGPIVAVISGPAGVGKTALARHWAHSVRATFPDGQLYANLRGFDPRPQPADPAEVLRGFLGALGVRPDSVPPTLDERSALFRSLLSARRMLVVLDNALDESQVRPLLPARGSVVVTSRHPLVGLTAGEDARRIPLGPLSFDESRILLSSLLGQAPSAATDRIISLCGRLPLALVIVAARAATPARNDLGEVVAELEDGATRLDALGLPGDEMNSVRGVLSWSYASLSPAAAELFRTLAAHPRTEIDLAAIASMAALPPGKVRKPLSELAAAQLIWEARTGRFGLHDLVWDYATELASPDPAVTSRLISHYLHSSTAAALRADRQPRAAGPPPLRPGAIALTFEDYAGALAWFDANSEALLASVRLAYRQGQFDAAWQVGWALTPFLRRQGRVNEWVAVHRIAVCAAARGRDRFGLASSYCDLATALRQSGKLRLAFRYCKRALAHFRAIGDHFGEGNTLLDACRYPEVNGRYAESLEYAEQMLAAFTAGGYRPGQARALNAIGWYETLLGRPADAVVRCEKALVVLEDVGDRSAQASTWDTLGYAWHRLGDYRQAIECFQRAIAILRDLGERLQIAEPLHHLANTYESMGEVTAARLTRDEATGLAEADEQAKFTAIMAVPR